MNKFKKILLLLSLILITTTVFAVDHLIQAPTGNLIINAATGYVIKINKTIQASTITTSSGNLTLDAATGSTVIVNKTLQASTITTSSGNLTLDAATGSAVLINKTLQVDKILNYAGTSSPPGMVPIGGMVAVMPATHANAWQPPASGVIKDGFMRADGASVPTCSDCIIPAGTVLPNMTSAFLMGSTVSTNTATSSNTKDLSHFHTQSAHTHDTTITHTHSYAHTHGTDSQLSTISISVSGSTTLPNHYHTLNTLGGAMVYIWDGYTRYGSSFGPAFDTNRYHTVNAMQTVGNFNYNSIPLTGTTANPTTNPSIGFTSTGTTATQAHTHTTNSQSSSTTGPASVATFTSGNPTAANTGTTLSASFDIRPAYLTTVWVIRVK